MRLLSFSRFGLRLRSQFPAAIIPCAMLANLVSAQDFSVGVTNADPLGLRNVVAGSDFLDGGSGSAIKGEFLYGLSLNTGYDSNLFLSEKNPEDELTTILAPWLTYSSDPEGGAAFSLAASYAPVVRMFLNNSDLNGVDQSGDIRTKLRGAKTEITAFVRYSELTGTDRLTGEFITGAQFNTGIQTSYQIAPRTSLQGDLSYILSDYGNSSGVGSDVYAVSFGGLWAATERLSFGPAFSYSRIESANIGSADGLALVARVQYLAGQKLRISGSAGMQSARYSDGDEENSLTQFRGDLQANYSLTERWSWLNNLAYVTVPSPTDEGYVVNNLSVSSTFSRSLLHGSWGFGLDLNLSNSEPVDSENIDLEDENTLGLFMFYTRTFFLDRLSLNTRAGYSMNDGEKNWDRFTVSTDLSVQF